MIIIFRVQTGAFRLKLNAYRLSGKLKRAGFSNFIIKEGNYWKVQVGAFSHRANASTQKDLLTTKGFSSFITEGDSVPARPSNVETSIRYALKLKGTPYGWWRGGSIPAGAPAWAKVGKAPFAWYIRARSIFCAGIPNVMLRRVGKKPPMRADGAGGRGGVGAYIGFWWKGTWYPGVYFRASYKFNSNVRYPAGTLLCRVYKSIQDQGHVGVVLSNGRILESRVNSYPGKWPGVTTNRTPKGTANYWHYAVYPKDWIL